MDVTDENAPRDPALCVAAPPRVDRRRALSALPAADGRRALAAGPGYVVQMSDRPVPIAIEAAAAPPRAKPSNYPEPFASRMAGREKRPLGDLFGLSAFGVNLTRLRPGAESALLHRHSRQEEFLFVLEGEPTLVTDSGEQVLRPGMCAGFRPGGRAHHLVNRSGRDAVYLEVGDRVQGDEGSYPADDIQAALGPDGKWRFAHKDGQPY
jgi:uncharacterized cupin superfamily protein